MAKKLPAPYTISEEARAALQDSAVEHMDTKDESQALAAVNVPSVIKTEEQAAGMSRRMSDVNRKMRAARPKRTSGY